MNNTIAKRLVALAVGGLILAGLGGCAHPISVGADTSKIVGTVSKKIDKKVGLQITDADKAKEVTTPGGGGDKVNYFPYRDLEAGLYTALGESFTSVSKVSGVADPKVQSEGLSLIFLPTITTNSSSDSALTWPPTKFSIDLVCKVVDAKGQLVTEIRTQGAGQAEFSEFKADVSLSARRAADDTLAKLVQQLAKDPALTK